MDNFKDIFEDSESGNYNVAKPYSLTKIMKPLYLADDCQFSARFGEIPGQIGGDTKVIRIQALERFIHYLKLALENSKLGIKPSFQDLAKQDYERLKILEKHIPCCYKINSNRVTKTNIINLDEQKFNILLDKVIEIKFTMNDYLNKSDLIFVHKEAFDPSAFKEKIKKDAQNKG